MMTAHSGQACNGIGTRGPREALSVARINRLDGTLQAVCLARVALRDLFSYALDGMLSWSAELIKELLSKILMSYSMHYPPV